MKPWLTVAEAAVLVGRDKRQVYRWIERKILGAFEADDGSLMVATEDVRRVASVVRRGRPRGSASRNGRRDG